MAITLTTEGALTIGSVIAVAAIVIYFYRFSNKRLMERIVDVKKKEAELHKLVDKLYDVRAEDNREMKRRLKAIEEKMDFMLKPESHEKEVEREKIRVSR